MARRLTPIHEPLARDEPQFTLSNIRIELGCCIRVVRAVGFSLTLLLGACGGRLATEGELTPGRDASPGTCRLGAATYTASFVVSGPQELCPDMPDRVVTFDDAGLARGLFDGGAEICVTNAHGWPCTFTAACSARSPSEGVTTTSLTFDGGAGAGTEVIDTTDPNLPAQCIYDVTLTTN